jgi:hypothetical protein
MLWHRKTPRRPITLKTPRDRILSEMAILLQLTSVLTSRRSNHEYRYVHRLPCVIVFVPRL